jgi:hypothetical protein
MPFFSGATDMDALIDLIADQLITTGAWADASGGSLPAGANPAKRAVVHLTDTNLYVTLDRNLASGNGIGNLFWNEIRIRISTGFSGSNPSGTIHTTGIPTEGQLTNTTASLSPNKKLGSHWTWVDAAGFTTQTVWAASSLQDYAVFFTLERNTSKEYADGLTNFFTAAIPNNNYACGSSGSNVQGRYYGNGATTNQRDAGRGFVCRPFDFQEYSDPYNAMEWFFGAYRSPGNSKVYFVFPYFSNNQLPLQRSPIAQTLRFFRIEPGQGLADGDLVTYAIGGNTYTYIVKTLQSPDSALYTPWAVRQA